MSHQDNWLLRHVYLGPSGIRSWRRLGLLTAFLFAWAGLLVPLSRITQPVWLAYVLAYSWGALLLAHAVMLVGSSFISDARLRHLQERADGWLDRYRAQMAREAQEREEEPW